MRKLFILFIYFLINIFCTNYDFAAEFSQIRVYFNQEFSFDKFQSFGIDFEGARIKKNTWCEVVVDDNELNQIKQSGCKYEIIIPDMVKDFLRKSDQYKKHDNPKILTPEKFFLGTFGGYYTLNEIYSKLDSLTVYYPDFPFTKIKIGKSIEGKSIYAYTFGNPESDNRILFTSLHHAREPGSATTIIYFLYDFFEKLNSNNAEAIYLWNNRTIYYIPVINPDGYAYNEITAPQGGGMWRKNRRQTSDTTYGIDINRNYGPMEFWDAPNFGSSDKQKDVTYRGSEPFSEPETQAVRDFCINRNIKIALNYHTYSNLLIFPYSALDMETNDSNLFRAQGFEFTKSTNYLTGRDIQTVNYATRGSSDDWMYTEISNKNKIFAFTPEIGSLDDNFWTTPDRIIQHGKDNLFMNYQTLWSADYNIRPKNLELLNDKNGTELNLTLINLGVNKQSQPIQVFINSNVKGIQIKDTLICVDLNPAETRKISFNTEINSKLVANGTEVKFTVSIIQDGCLREDLLSIPVYAYNEISLFSNGSLSGSWDKGSWGPYYDPARKNIVMSDSPSGNYIDSAKNYLTLLDPINLNFNNSELLFDAYWQTEPSFDFGVIEISTDDGENWEKLVAERMIEGSTKNKTSINTGEFGFTGTSLIWQSKKINLKKYIGKNILLRFGMLSDNAVHDDGFFLDNIVLHNYDNISDVSEKSIIDDYICLFPNPIKTGQELHFRSDFYRPERLIIKDLKGRELMIKNIPNSTTDNFKIDLPSGTYIVIFYSEDKQIYKKLIVD